MYICSIILCKNRYFFISIFILFRIESKSKFPELGKVYPGKVLNIVDFGCFVQLDMFRQSQGLVHISQLRQKGRVTSVSDVVSRGDKVMVSNYHLATLTYLKTP